MNVRVRFPPSPTGFCHVGTARMALLNYLFAKKKSGTIIFRSEDTDRERSSKEFEEDIIEQLTWLTLSWNEFYRQSERTLIYTKALNKLIEEDKAYISHEESKREPGRQVEIIRLRNPGVRISFNDIIRGEISFDTTELGDFVVARAIDEPLYHLAVVVDDGEMKISHVIRGEDHISNTPRQILIQEALGFPRPTYAHYPLNLGTDRSKLSKRTGDVAVRLYRERGFLPEALINYIGIVGWTPSSQKELLSLPEMISEFELEDLHKSGAIFDIEKLRWYNRQYLITMSDDDFAKTSLKELGAVIKERELEWDEHIARLLLPLIKERVHVWEDLRTMVGAGELDFFFKDPVLESKLIPEKKSAPVDARRHLLKTQELLSTLSNFSEVHIKNALWEYASLEGRGAVLWPFRYSLTGHSKSPDPFFVGATVGKETTLRRVARAIALLMNI